MKHDPHKLARILLAEIEAAALKIDRSPATVSTLVGLSGVFPAKARRGIRMYDHTYHIAREKLDALVAARAGQ